jgi:hypothetical protein
MTNRFYILGGLVAAAAVLAASMPAEAIGVTTGTAGSYQSSGSNAWNCSAPPCHEYQSGTWLDGCKLKSGWESWDDDSTATNGTHSWSYSVIDFCVLGATLCTLADNVDADTRYWFEVKPQSTIIVDAGVSAQYLGSATAYPETPESQSTTVTIHCFR